MRLLLARRLALLTPTPVFVLWSACAGDPIRYTPPAGHPARADAEEAPPPEVSTTLSLTPASAPSEDAPTRPALAAERYACPMHPEVVSDQPARCPKCGMALKKTPPPIKGDRP